MSRRLRSLFRRVLPLLPGVTALALAGASGGPAACVAAPGRTGEETAPKPIARGLQLRGHLNVHSAYSGIWGYTAPDGREYALVGASDGTSIVNITDRANPYEAAFIPGPTSGWREIKTYRKYMYVVNETGGGMQILNLEDPENPRPVAAYVGFSTAHNITIEPRNHCAYICGSNVGEGGVQILWLGEPRSPSLLGEWQDTYAHDVHVRGDVMYVSAITRGALYIVNIRDVRNPRQLSIIGNYPSAYTHNAWTTADARYVLTTDEVPGASTRIWDISDPKAPAPAGAFRPPGATGSSPHNVFVDGHLAYIAHYTAGVRVVDISDPNEPVQVAFYDTQPTTDSGIFHGCWGLFPYYRNSPGLFVACDMSEGLFILEIAREYADAEAGGVGGDGGAEYYGDGFASGDGAPPGGLNADAGHPAAGAAAPGFTISARGPNPLRPGVPTTFDLALPRPAAASVDVFDASGRLVRRLTDVGSARGRASFSWDAQDERGRAVAAGSYWLSIRAGDARESRRVVVLR